MPRHTIYRRSLLPEELEHLGPPRGSEAGDWGCAVSILALAIVAGCAGGLILQVSLEMLTRVQSLPYLLALLALIPAAQLARWLYRRTRVTRVGRTHDHDDGIAEVIEVWDAVAAQQLAHDDEGPFYFLDIGEGKVLALAGPELALIPEYRDGLPWPPASEHEAEWPPGFLTTHFLLHRLPRSGRVLRIDVVGEPIAVSRSLPARTVPIAEGESRVIDGTLDTLVESGGHPA